MKNIKTYSKLPTVTLALSAYNEEKNIKTFLRSVLKQKEEGFVLEKIVIYSDGSTDKTVEKIREINSKKITVYDGSNRLGKSSRLNQIYSSLTSDYLVQSDADVRFAHKYVIRDIVLPLIRYEGVGMCGGNPRPTPGKTFVQKAVNCTFFAHCDLRKDVRGGNNVFSVDGRLLSYKKSLVKKITVPPDMIANDAYTYFSCLTYKYKYRFIESAVVFFESPQTLRDQIRQNTRFLAAEIRMSKHFPRNLVRRESIIPKKYLFKKMFTQFVKHPVMCTYILLVNRYCHVRAFLKEKSMTAKWDIAITTKREVANI